MQHRCRPERCLLVGMDTMMDADEARAAKLRSQWRPWIGGVEQKCGHSHLMNLRWCLHCGKEFLSPQVWRYGPLWFWDMH